MERRVADMEQYTSINDVLVSEFLVNPRNVCLGGEQYELKVTSRMDVRD